MKKSPAKRNSKTKKSLSLTGAELPFSISESKSFRPPRKVKEYRKLKVRELWLRIFNDLEELMARAMSDEKSLQIDFECANFNGDEGWKEGVQESMKGIETSEPKNAAKAVALLASEFTRCLENLAYVRKLMLNEIAMEFSEWPVNLTLNNKRNLKRVDFAKAYLKMLDVNRKAKWPISQIDSLPNQIAARDLYHILLMMKRDFPVFTKSKNKWTKGLTALRDPMSEESFPAWWKVAKIYLDEQWEINRLAFEPLIKSTTAVFHSPSILKRNVIDVNLKSAFKTLAKQVVL